MSEHESHWFDRLAARHTRREALKVAVAGAALSIPTLRPAAALAADPNACRQGCNWTAHQSYVSGVDTCQKAIGITSAPLGGLSLLFGPLAGVVFVANLHNAIVAGQACNEAGLTQQKADYFDCLQPGCSGFDPKQKGGPCDTCTATCCVDPTVISGYSCCALGCACGNDGGACHSGSNPC